MLDAAALLRDKFVVHKSQLVQGRTREEKSEYKLGSRTHQGREIRKMARGRKGLGVVEIQILGNSAACLEMFLRKRRSHRKRQRAERKINEEILRQGNGFAQAVD